MVGETGWRWRGPVGVLKEEPVAMETNGTLSVSHMKGEAPAVAVSGGEASLSLTPPRFPGNGA